MQPEDIRKAVLAAITAVAPETDVQRLRPDQPLRQQVELDSMDWLNVIAGLHDRLGIEVSESDYDRLTTLDAIVGYATTALARPPDATPRPTDAGAALPRRQYRVDGTEVTVRPIRADDLPLEADFVRHLSADTRYDRFMVTVGELPQAKLRYLTDVDQVRHVALVATVERDGREVIVGVVRYIVEPPGTGCEFAIAIDDGWHGSGLAGILMHELIGVARARGLRAMEGIVLAANPTMLHFAHQLGFRSFRDPDERDAVRVVLAL